MRTLLLSLFALAYAMLALYYGVNAQPLYAGAIFVAGSVMLSGLMASLPAPRLQGRTRRTLREMQTAERLSQYGRR